MSKQDSIGTIIETAIDKKAEQTTYMIIPLIGWLMGLTAALSVSIPFWFLWTYCGLGAKYFYFLPELFHYLPFWDIVGLFLIMWLLKSLIPTAHVSQRNEQGKDNKNETNNH